MQRSLMTVILFVVAVFVATSQTTRRVPQDYATIQGAIDAAVTGDTVLVAEGIYSVNLLLTKKIVLGSLFVIDGDTSHISGTILDGGTPANPDSGSVVLIGEGTDTTTVISGFTIRNGKGTTGSWGGMPYIVGGGVAIIAGGATISHNVITNNTCLSSLTHCGAAGIDVEPNQSYTVGPKECIITNNIISGNTSTSTLSNGGVDGGGLAMTGRGRIVNNIIQNNSAIGTSYGGGGGILIYGWNLQQGIEITGNLIKGNIATRGAGIATWANLISGTYYGPNVTLTNNIIVGNTNASALYLLSGTYALINNTIASNSGPYAIALFNSRGAMTFRMMNTIVWNPSVTTGEFYNGGLAAGAFNCVRNGFVGLGNISSDPLFADSDPAKGLAPTSPCIDAGAMSATVGVVLNAPTVDYLGAIRPRPIGSKPDMGAIESDAGKAVRRVPEDIATIQGAIDASANGDAVIVSEGTYPVNLLLTKKITLASRYYVDGDTSHISKTILDGSTPSHADSGSTVTFGPGTDSTSKIIGFTITGGKGNRHMAYDTNPPWPFVAGGGIDIYKGGASVLHNIIRNNALSSATDSATGGGICAATWSLTEQTSHVIIEDNTILQNSSMSSGAATGGGITLWGTSGRVMRNRINNNSTKYGGGMTVWAMASWGMDTLTIGENVVQDNYASVNTGGIDAAGNGLMAYIRDNKVKNNVAANSMGGISVGLGMVAVVDGNYVSGNAAVGGTIGGIYVYNSATTNVWIQNNIVVGNDGDGVRSGFRATARVVNNTIVGNSRYGLNTYDPPSATQYATIVGLNNIVWGNALGGIAGNVYASYSLVQGGFAGTGNISYDPLLAAGDTLYQLVPGSPALGAGVLSATVGGLTLTAPALDYLGAARPIPDTTHPDLGAIEHYLWDPLVRVEEPTTSIPTEFGLEQNYPNPFNPATEISYQLPLTARVSLTVFDLLGREVAVLVNEEKPSGSYTAQWNAAGFASGIYLVRMQAGSFVDTKKIVLMK